MTHEHLFAHIKEGVSRTRKKAGAFLDKQIDEGVQKSFQPGPGQRWHRIKTGILVRVADIISPIPNARE